MKGYCKQTVDSNILNKYIKGGQTKKLTEEYSYLRRTFLPCADRINKVIIESGESYGRSYMTHEL